MTARVGKKGWAHCGILLVAILFLPSQAHAGMRVYTLTDVVAARLQVISFFVAFSLVLAFVFQRCWNALVPDFPRIPVLSYRKSIAFILVASLFCGLILTMISGARELMTPGAWDKTGTGYKLREPKQEPATWLDAVRRRSMEQFRDALWEYARLHDGRLPQDYLAKDLLEGVWKSPDSAGTPYGYLPRRDTKVSPSPESRSYVLAHEPLTFGEQRFVLFSSGEVSKLSARELAARVDSDTKADLAVQATEPRKP